MAAGAPLLPAQGTSLNATEPKSAVRQGVSNVHLSLHSDTMLRLYNPVFNFILEEIWRIFRKIFEFAGIYLGQARLTIHEVLGNLKTR